MVFRNLSTILLAWAFCCHAAWAQEKWLLTNSQFKSETVQLKGLDASGIKVASIDGGSDRILPLDQFLDLSRVLPAAASSGKFVLHMTGSDQLGGEPVALKAESMVWKNPTLGEISIPTSRMIAITPPGKPVPSERRHEDVVKLANGDTVSGIIASMTADKVTVQTPAGNSDLPLSSVASINFAVTPGGADTQHGFRVRLDDGSSLVGAAAKLDGDKLVLTIGKNTDRSVPLAHVAAIEQVNGPVSWLSSRTPSQAVYYPFIGPPREPAAYMDQRWGGGGAIEFLGRQFPHGIGVHARSAISWTLDGKYAAFRTRFAIDGDSTIADATVRIKLDDKVVYEKTDVRAGWLSPVVIEDLAGAKKLTLEVDGPYYAQDSLDWIEPALLRQKPPPEPAAIEQPATQPATRPASQPATAPATRSAGTKSDPSATRQGQSEPDPITTKTIQSPLGGLNVQLELHSKIDSITWTTTVNSISVEELIKNHPELKDTEWYKQWAAQQPDSKGHASDGTRANKETGARRNTGP